MNFYDIKVQRPDGSFLYTEQLRGKVVLVVNTATGCGFTPHYKPLEDMYEKYHDLGFEIIDVPCNQFKNQTPGTDEEIHQFCTIRYSTKFPQMKKSHVNGEDEIELFKFLKGEKGFSGFGKGPKALAMSIMLKSIDKNYKNNPDIKWNFTKFLIDRQGNVIERFEPTYDMKKLEEKVKQLLEN